MLNTNLIRTVLTENEYDNQNDQLALLYAKKSLDEFVNQKELQPLATNQANQISITKNKIKENLTNFERDEIAKFFDS